MPPLDAAGDLRQESFQRGHVPISGRGVHLWLAEQLRKHVQERTRRESLGRVHRVVPMHDRRGAMSLLHNRRRPVHLAQQPQAALDQMAAVAASQQLLDLLGERVLRDDVLVAQDLKVFRDAPTRQAPRATPRGLEHGAVDEGRRERGRLQDVGAQHVRRVPIANESCQASPRRVLDAGQPLQLPRHGRLELFQPRADAVVLQELEEERVRDRASQARDDAIRPRWADELPEAMYVVVRGFRVCSHASNQPVQPDAQGRG